MASDAVRRSFLLPVDGSEHSQRSVDYYLKTIKRDGDEVRIVNIVEAPPVPVSLVLTDPLKIDDEYKKELEKKYKMSQGILENYRLQLESQGVNCHLHADTGANGPGQTICSLAEEGKVDGIVMGARGLGWIGRTFLGSVSNYVLHHSSVPVTVTPPEYKPHGLVPLTDDDVMKCVLGQA